MSPFTPNQVESSAPIPQHSIWMGRVGAWSRTNNEQKHSTNGDSDAGAKTGRATHIDNAASTDDTTELAPQYLTVIDGTLCCWERSGHTYPMEAMPDVLKQWLKDQCRDFRQKCEWIRYLMEAPLDPSEFDGRCVTPYNDLKSEEEIKSAIAMSLDELNEMYGDMERLKPERDQKLEEALQLDFDYRAVRRDVEWCTTVIKQSIEKDGQL